MEEHLFFCCCTSCKDYEIRNLMKMPYKTSTVKGSVVIMDDVRTRFLTSNDVVQLDGIRIDSWKRCIHAKLSEKTLLILRLITKEPGFVKKKTIST
jgi:hypothetical protein